MSIILKDYGPNYDDLRDVTPGSAVAKGQVQLRRDVYGFFMYDESANVETTFIDKAKQCLADKKTGTGEGIESGEFVYGDPTDSFKVSATKGGGYVYLGIAKETVGGSATTVLIDFDGTMTDVR